MVTEAQSVIVDVQSLSAVAAEPAASAAALEQPAFEELLQDLEALVSQLESGDLPLNEALQTFERGVRLTRQCQAALTVAQQKVQLLLQRGDGIVLEELDRGAIEAGSGPGAAASIAGADGAA